MNSPFDILTNEDNEAFYTHLMSIWEVIPEKVKDRFKREQKCVLCNNCVEVITKVQTAIRKDKDEKRKQQSESKSKDL